MHPALNHQLLSKSAPNSDRRLDADLRFVVDKIGHIFRDIFQIEVREDDDFFDLGGDSLAGETLLAGIERDFELSLPLSILLESSTPRSLAAAVVAKKNSLLPTIIAAVTAAGSRTPLFCIHGANGTAAFARKLRSVLTDRPIYAIRALGVVPNEVPFISVPEIAQFYVCEMRKVQPSGPYHIFGQCSTSNVAYEVAQQLSAAGEMVATLTLGDPLRLERPSSASRFRHWLKGKRAIRTARRLSGMSGNERWHKIAKPALVAALKAYEPRPYCGLVLIVTASHRAGDVLDPKRGYPALITELETIVVNGTHRDVFTAMETGTAGKLGDAMSSFLVRHD